MQALVQQNQQHCYHMRHKVLLAVLTWELVHAEGAHNPRSRQAGLWDGDMENDPPQCLVWHPQSPCSSAVPVSPALPSCCQLPTT